MFEPAADGHGAHLRAVLHHKGAEGNGLGLTVVHHIVTLAGGMVEVESAVGQGTTMRVLLPAIAAPIA
jgi:signal transduction histidine kinase